MAISIKRKIPLPPQKKQTKTEETKRKGWSTPYGFADFSHPVTYEDACDTMKKIIDELEG